MRSLAEARLEIHWLERAMISVTGRAVVVGVGLGWGCFEHGWTLALSRARVVRWDTVAWAYIGEAAQIYRASEFEC